MLPIQTPPSSPIKSHVELAATISGKKILLLNSYGKDASLCLHWLNSFANPSKIVAVHMKLQAAYSTDESFAAFQARIYSRVKFVTVPSVAEMNEKMEGQFQSPLWINYVLNNQEFESFYSHNAIEELRIKYECDYVASGISCYEGMGRALYLRRVGLLDESRKMIYPIGLMKQKQVKDLLKQLKIPLNPCYHTSDASHDSASYFKMRNAFLSNPEFKRTVMNEFPMLALDEYRYERLRG